MRCPQCGNHVVQRSGEQVRLRVNGPLTIDLQGVCRGRCYWCKTEVQLPLQLCEDQPVEVEQLTVRVGPEGRVLRRRPAPAPAPAEVALDEPGADPVG